jgi:hypothetical protein
MIIEKNCLKELYGISDGILIHEKYVHVSLINCDSGPSCHLGNDDDWEMSFAGQDAEYKFMLILEEKNLTVSFLIEQGFTQYG